jgi:tetratricopeptide (TPR) repeat protein
MRIKTIVLLLAALSAASLFAQAKPRLAILPFTEGSPDDAESIAEFFSYEPEINRVFIPVPRTRAIEILMKEQEFQRSGLTDSDTIAELGKQLNADYVLAGHIAVLGGSTKLLLITIVDVKELQQIAGDYREYQQLERVVDLLPGMAKRIAGAVVQGNSGLPRLAVLPFNVLSSGMDQGDAELLAQLLATELANSGAYAVFPRTKAIEKVMEEHHIERSGMTDPESIKAIGEAINARYVLSANVRRLGTDNYFSASILHIAEASQGQGTREQYRTVNDGLTIMPRMARVLSGATAHVEQGDAYYFKGNYDQALEEYDEAVRLYPAYAAAWARRGNVYHTQGNDEKRNAEYAQAVRLNPDYGPYHRGLMARDAGEYNRAVEELTRALELMPGYVFAYNNRGNVYLAKRDYDRAIADYTEVIRINPQYAIAYNNRGLAYYYKKDYDRAIADYTEAIRINPQYANAYTSRGTAYYDKKDYDRAIADYTEAIRVNPQYAGAYTNRGNAYKAKGDTARANADYAEAERINRASGTR